MPAKSVSQIARLDQTAQVRLFDENGKSYDRAVRGLVVIPIETPSLGVIVARARVRVPWGEVPVVARRLSWSAARWEFA